MYSTWSLHTSYLKLSTKYGTQQSSENRFFNSTPLYTGKSLVTPLLRLYSHCACKSLKTDGWASS